MGAFYIQIEFINRGDTMQKRPNSRRERGITRYTREAERTFFFYATVAMFILWGILKFF